VVFNCMRFLPTQNQFPSSEVLELKFSVPRLLSPKEKNLDPTYVIPQPTHPASKILHSKTYQMDGEDQTHLQNENTLLCNLAMAVGQELTEYMPQMI